MGTEMNSASKIPQRTDATALDEQLEQLRTDEQMLRFAESRKRLSSDPYRPVYHYVNPEGNLGDPNGLCCWQGRSHMFYQAGHLGTRLLQGPTTHWGHAVSDDLVRWRDLPPAICPDMEAACYSGSTLVEEDRVIAMYHGTRAGNMIAMSRDPLLLNWEKIPGNPVIPLMPVDPENQRPYVVFDPCIWKEEDGYYSLSGKQWDGMVWDDSRMVQHLFFSRDLTRWTYLGPLIADDPFTALGEDGAVPYFWPIGDRHILIFASHQRGAQYLLGDYDKVHHKFVPYWHDRFRFGPVERAAGAAHAASATPDGKGGVYVIHNINSGRPTRDPGHPDSWNNIMSLARVLTLREDSLLGIDPVAAVESLRSDRQHVGETLLPANQEIVLEGIEGNTMEIAAEIDPQGAREVCINVLRSPDGEEYTAIKLYRHGGMVVSRDGRRQSRERAPLKGPYSNKPFLHQLDVLAIDASRSSLRADVFARPPELAPFVLEESESLKLRIFIDKSVVEVFANGKQAVALRVYPERKDSIGVSLRAQGRDATLCSLDAWQMKSIWTPE